MVIKIKTEYKKSSGFVYNKKYYVLEAIFKSQKFERQYGQILQELQRVEFIIPAKRRNNPQIYEMDKLIDELKDKGVDIVRIASDILSDFGIEVENIKQGKNNYYDYLHGILNKIFFNQPLQYEPYGFPNYKYDNEKNPTELWIQIHPWTTKEAYDNYFPFITVLKGKLLDSIHRIKPWKTFERDLELYKLFLKVKANVKRGVIKRETMVRGYNTKVLKSIYEQLLFYPEYNEIKRRFPSPNFDDANVARLISDTKKKLDNIQLL